MGYNNGHQKLNPQQQEIRRQKERAEKKTVEERKRNQELENLILDFLKVQPGPITRNEIFTGTGLNAMDILKTLSILKQKKKIDSSNELDKISGLESEHFIIIPEPRTKI